MKTTTRIITRHLIRSRSRGILALILLAAFTSPATHLPAQPTIIDGLKPSYTFSDSGAYTLTGTVSGGLGMQGSMTGVDLTINADALASGSSNGISLSSGGGVINNAGTIIGISDGIHSGTAPTLVINSGLIHGIGDDAIQLSGGGTVANSGTIKGNWGVYADGTTSALVTNSANAVISATGLSAVYLNAGGTVTNAGSIINETGHGVWSNSTALITNQADGTIQGNNNGVRLENGGTVVNYGEITSGTNYGVYIGAGEGRVENNTGATITGGIYAGGTTTVVNDGTVSGTLGIWLGADSKLEGAGSMDVTGTALILLNGATHTNPNEIKGSVTGVSFTGTGSLINSGTIIGTSNNGVEATAGSVAITNSTSGVITGGIRGVSLAAGGTVTNSGTISGLAANTSAGVYATGAATVSNTTGGLIQSRRYGVQLAAGAGGSTITNSGTIIGLDANGEGVSAAVGVSASVDNAANALIQGGIYGVRLQGGGTVTNSGAISGTAADGVGLFVQTVSATVTNGTTGLISGGNYGVQFSNAAGSNTIINSGTIIGNGAAGRGITANVSVTVTNTGGLIQGASNGIVFDTGAAGGKVFNSGTINGAAANGYGIRANASSTIANDGGLIQGGQSGILFQAGGTVTNSGVISGTTINNTSAGITATNNAVSITNDGGLIDGGRNGILLSTGAAGSTITNSGTIIGLKTDNGQGVTSTVSASVDNAAGGLITGPYLGIYMTAGGTVTNAGIISGTAVAGGIGVHITTNLGLVTNNGGLIEGLKNGVRLTGGGSVANSGTITAINEAGVEIFTNSGAVSNDTTDSLIQGGQHGVYMTGGGTVTNDGTIIGTNQGGIYAQENITVTNNAGGLIKGATAGAFLVKGGTITNSGTIASTSPSLGQGIFSAESLVLTNTGAAALIEGFSHGAQLSKGGVITNDGIIRSFGANGNGIASGVDLTLTNNSNALIEGDLNGINATGALTVTNSGTIRGLAIGSVGIVSTNLTDITNSGHIEGGSVGIQLGSGAAGSTILNTGTIRAVAGSEAIVSATSILVTNTAGGLIEGGNIGVWLQGGGTVANHALITGGTTGVRLDQGGEVTNTGTIIGTAVGSGVGVYSGGIVTITNTTGGLIRGGAYGVQLEGVNTAGSTVTNTGTISGTSATASSGISSSALVTIDNAAGGLIQGGAYGVWLSSGAAGSAITNTGTISGIAAGGIGIGINSNGIVTITNTTGGLVRGGAVGVQLTVGGTVTNSGTISGTSATGYGVNFGDIGTITNSATGVIQGGAVGVNLAASGTVSNFGEIRGDAVGSTGVYATGEAVITNENTTSTISGGYAGVQLAGGGTVTNTGTIAGRDAGGSFGVRATTAPVAINNKQNAVIEGTGIGAYLGAGGEVTNAGKILGNTHGVHAEGALTLTNSTSALIQGASTGVRLNADATITNSGTILGAGSHGVETNGSAVLMLTNEASGLVRGALDGVHVNDGGGTVVNKGTIQGDTKDGVYMGPGASGLVINSGLIESRSVNEDGVHLALGGTVQNTGTILGAYGIFGGGGSMLVENGAGALINATTTAVLLDVGGTVTNAGTITGATATGVSGGALTVVTNTTGGVISGPTNAINLTGDAANEVRLWNSSTLDGNLLIAGAASQLTLNGGAGTEQRYSDAVTGDTTFSGTLIKQGAGTWTIDKDPGADMRQAATLVQGGTLAVEWGKHQLYNTVADISAGATLQVSATVNSTVNNALTGAGLLDLANTNADTNAATIDYTLGGNVGANFTGTVGLRGENGGAHLVLDTNAQNALRDATLSLGINGSTTVDASVTGTIGTLDLAGGALVVVTNTIVSPVAPSVLNTGTLSVGNGASQIHLADGILNGIDATGTLTGHLFDVDGDHQALVVKADALGNGAAVGNGFTVRDAHGNELIPPSGTTAATAIDNGTGTVTGTIHYGYTATIVEGGTLGTGIALGYGVSKIESTTSIADGLGVTLDPTGSVDKTLSAQLSGTGDFTFTGGGTLSLGFVGNDYEGASLITGTTVVRALADNALGLTSSLAIEEKSALELNNHSQTIDGDTTLADSARIALGGEDAVFWITGNLTGGDSVQLHADGGYIGANGDITLGHNATIDLGASTGKFGANGNLTTGTAADINLRGGAMVATDMTFGDASTINFGTSTGMVITRDNLTTGENTVINANGGELTVGGELFAETGAAINLASGTATIGGIDIADTAGINLGASGALNINGDGTLHGDNALTGGDTSTITLTGDTDVYIHGANTGFTGNVYAGNDSSWGGFHLTDLAGLGNSGTVFLGNAGPSCLYLDASGTFSKNLASASGVVIIEDDRTVLVTGNNTGLGENAAFWIGESGTLRTQSQSALGSALIEAYGDDATLRLEGYAGELRNELTNNLTVHVAESSTVTIARDNSYLDNDARAIIDAGSALALTGSYAMGDASLLTNDGSLSITHADAVVATATLANNADLYISYDGTVSNPFVSTATATTTLDAAGFDMTLASDIGNGNLVLPGSGVTTITVAQTHAGTTLVENGTLRADVANALQNSSALTLRNAMLDLNNHSQSVKNLHAENARINYSTPNGLATNYATLTITGNLTGDTDSVMNVDLFNEKSDKLVVQGAASGTHFVHLNSTNDTPLDDPTRTYALKVIDYTTGDAVFESNGLESGMHTYELHKGDGGLIMPDQNAYYLSGGDALSRAADAILFTAGVMGTDWHYELDNVYKRFGDIRGNIGRDTGSVWARANTYRLNASSELGGSTFEQDTYGITAGVDKVFAMDNGYHVAVGGFIGMSRSDRTFDDARNQYGDGSSNSLTIGAYALWLFDNGWYVDATLKLDRYSNDLKARGVDGFVSHGEYTNHVQGLGVEVGRRVNLLQTATSESSKLAGITVWAEPSAQVAAAWINGANYTVSNGVSRDLEVRISDSDAWQYRLQVRTGANIGRWMPYIKLATVKTDTSGGRVTVEGRRYSPDYDGWRFETGVGAGFMIDPQSAVYLDYEYNKASAYERPWSVNLGYRRAW